MLVHFIGCTHGFHTKLEIPECDMICHTGDFSNYRDPNSNFLETIDFLEWYGSLEIRCKILGCGNHDTYSEAESGHFKQLCKDNGVIPLIHEGADIEGLKIFATPYTPTYGDWAYMKSRGTELEKAFKQIPDDTAILISHGPPFGIGNLADHIDNRKLIAQVGSKTLLNRVNQIKPKVVAFSHIHNTNRFKNRGIYDFGESTKFINCACYQHKPSKAFHNGFTQEI